MSHRAFARKYRPKNITEVFGQSGVITPLTNALKNDKIHHAYLFSGTRGVGKTTIARALVKCLNCESGITANPCDNCENCKSCDNGTFIDFIEIDAASHSKVEEIRDLLEQVNYLPSKNRKKIILLDEVHMLSKHSFNALLKTLEEPPSHLIFIFATTEIESVPATIKSRCILFHLQKISIEIICENLTKICKLESIQADQSALLLIAKHAQGSMRDALSILENASAAGDGTINDSIVESVLGPSAITIISLYFKAIFNHDKQAFIEASKSLQNFSGEIVKVLDQFLYYLQKSAFDNFVIPDETKQLSIPSQKMLQVFIQIAVEARIHFIHHPDTHAALQNTMLRMMLYSVDAIDASERDMIEAAVLSKLDATLVSVKNKK